MYLDEFAHKILNSHKLDDKLYFPERLIYNDYEAKNDIIKPSREASISFDRLDRPKPEFKKIQHLESDFAKAAVFHFFANHELLALELMAMALLKFPQAPKAYKASLVLAMQDEQQHLKFYLERMQAYSMQFGDLQLNSFFWSCLNKVKTYKEFCAGLSLCFEQANLDFSLEYQQAFFKMGDLQSANHLQQVYEDEIRHVQMAFHWFKEWQDPNKSFWQDWQDNMQLPLGPQRAKGKKFSVQARKAVGFDSSYIKELEFFTASKGRAADVFLFNPDCEYKQNILHSETNNQDSIYTSLRQDLSSIVQFFAKQDDIVLCSKKVSKDFLAQLDQLQIPRQEFLEVDPKDLSSYSQMAKRKYHSLKSWGFDKDLCRLSNQDFFHKSNLQNEEELQSIYSKIFSAQTNFEFCQFMQNNKYIDSHMEESKQVHNLQEIETFLLSNDCIILKSPFGSSGQANLVVQKEKYSTLKPKVQNLLEASSVLIAEKFYKRCFDFSFHFEREAQEIQFLGMQRFLVSPEGHFRACVLRKFDYRFNEDEKQFYFHSNAKQDFEAIGQEMAKFLQSKFKQNNFSYNGPLGVDAFVYQKNNQYFLRPMVEMNCRYSFGRLALELQKYVDYRSLAFLKVETISSFNKKNKLKSKEELIEFFENNKYQIHPKSKKLSSGLFPLVDLKHCQKFIAYLNLSLL